jgi:hypothetical protein
MFAMLRQLYWRLQYRPGRMIMFTHARDGITEILVVENRIASSETICYRKREINVWAPRSVQCAFGPALESSIQEMIQRIYHPDRTYD